MMNWPRIIKDLRRSRGLKQAALAEMLGVTQPAISHWERGIDEPTVALQTRIRDLLVYDANPQEALLQSAVRHSPNMSLLMPDLFILESSAQVAADVYRLTPEEVKGTDTLGLFGDEFDHRQLAFRSSGFFMGELTAVEIVHRFYEQDPVFASIYCIPQVITDRGLVCQGVFSPITEEEHDAFIRDHGSFMLRYPID